MSNLLGTFYNAMEDGGDVLDADNILIVFYRFKRLIQMEKVY